MQASHQHPPKRLCASTRSQQGAFSLLELMVVLALLSVLMGLVTPAMAARAPERDRFFAAHQLYAELHRARLLAVTQATHLTLCPSQSGDHCDGTNAWHQGWIAFKDPDKSGQPENRAAVLAYGEAQPDLRITSGGRVRVRFQPQGTAYGNNLTIEFCSAQNHGRATTLVVSNPGRIRLLEGGDCHHA